MNRRLILVLLFRIALMSIFWMGLFHWSLIALMKLGDVTGLPRPYVNITWE